MNRKIKVIVWSIMVLILGMSSVFAQENEQEEQELCEGVPELEAQAFLLEQSIMAAQEDGAEVEVPLPEPSSEMVEGEIPSCDEITALIEDRIEQLEAYIDDNGIVLLDEEEMEEIKEKNNFQKQEKELDDQSGNDVSAMMSQGMPSCEQNTMLLIQRIADLEQFIEDNDLEVPEPSEDEATAVEENEVDSGEESEENGTDGQEASEEKQEEPKQGFFKGMFKKMFGFFDENKDAEQQSQQPMMPPPMMEEPNEEANEATEESSQAT